MTVGALVLAWSLSQEDRDQRLAEAAAARNERASPTASALVAEPAGPLLERTDGPDA